MTRPDELLEKVLNVVLRLVAVHSQLFEDHHPLALDVRLVELRVGDDVEQHVKPKAHVLRWHAGPVGSQLLVGGGVDEASDALDRVGDLLRRRTPAGAFEVEVLDEMRHAGEAVVLEARAAGEHQDHARGVALRHRLDDEAGAAGQRVDPVGGVHGNGKYRCR